MNAHLFEYMYVWIKRRIKNYLGNSYNFLTDLYMLTKYCALPHENIYNAAFEMMPRW
jgi:hypothetical protein